MTSNSDSSKIREYKQRIRNVYIMAMNNLKLFLN